MGTRAGSLAGFGAGHIEVSIVYLVWGTSSLLIRLAGETALTITVGRFVLGALTVCVYGLLTRQRDWGLGTNPKLLLLLGIYAGVSMLSYAAAVQYTTVANANLVGFSSTVLVPFVARWWLKERVRRVALVALALGLSGLLLILVSELSQFEERSLLGVLFAMISASGLVMVTVGVRLVRRSAGVFNVALYRTVLPSLVLMPLALNPAQAFSLTPTAIACIAILGVVHTGAATLLHAHGIGRIQAQDAVVLTYFEPLGAIVLAALFLGEGLTFQTVVGGALILLGSYLVARQSKAGFES